MGVVYDVHGWHFERVYDGIDDPHDRQIRKEAAHVDRGDGNGELLIAFC